MKYRVRDAEGYIKEFNDLKDAAKCWCDHIDCSQEDCPLGENVPVYGNCLDRPDEDILNCIGNDIEVIHDENDPVNHPAHYTAGGIECIDAIAAALTCQKDPMSAWLTGQVLKYLWRWPMKNGLEDLKKAQFYLNRLIEKEKKDDKDD